MPRPAVALPPDAVRAPFPEFEEWPLPFEADPGPELPSCRRCGRSTARIGAELRVAREAIDSLEELLVWMRDEVMLANGARELVEAEAGTFRALVLEYEEIAAAHDLALASTKRALLGGRRARDEAGARARAQEERASRLAAELKRLKDARTQAAAAGAPRREKGAAAPARAAAPRPAVAVGPTLASRPAVRAARSPAAMDDVLDLALAACGASESEGRILELESQLRAERTRSARYERYVQALEARLRSLADAGVLDLEAAPA